MRRLIGVRTLLLALVGIAVLTWATRSNAETRGTAPAPELTYLAFSHNGTSQVWSATATGSQRRRLGPGFASFGAQPMSPNGRYFATIPLSVEGLTLYRTGGGKPIRVFRGSNYEAVGVAWSPDSRYMAVSWQQTTKLKTASGTRKRRDGIDIVAVPSGRVLMSVSKIGTVSDASFAPTKPYRVVYFEGNGQSYGRPGALKELRFTPSSHGVRASLKSLLEHKRIDNPLWTRYGIVYDVVRPPGFRRPNHQLALLRHGRVTVLTGRHLSSGAIAFYPIAASSNGTRLVVNRLGNTEESYTVNLVDRRIRLVKVGNSPPGSILADGITANGKRVLVNYLSFVKRTAWSNIATAPFGGGKPKVLVHITSDIEGAFWR
jgi:WD40 repeat protein